MKKLLAIALMGLLLVPVMVSPAWSGGGRHGGGGWHGGGGYRGGGYYGYPPPPAPPADSGALVQPSQSTSVTYGQPPAPPAGQGSAPTGGQNCQTVTVEGQKETRTLQSGQTITAWVPTYTQQVCQ